MRALRAISIIRPARRLRIKANALRSFANFAKFNHGREKNLRRGQAAPAARTGRAETGRARPGSRPLRQLSQSDRARPAAVNAPFAGAARGNVERPADLFRRHGGCAPREPAARRPGRPAISRHPRRGFSTPRPHPRRAGLRGCLHGPLPRLYRAVRGAPAPPQRPRPALSL